MWKNVTNGTRPRTRPRRVGTRRSVSDRSRSFVWVALCSRACYVQSAQRIMSTSFVTRAYNLLSICSRITTYRYVSCVTDCRAGRPAAGGRAGHTVRIRRSVRSGARGRRFVRVRRSVRRSARKRRRPDGLACVHTSTQNCVTDGHLHRAGSYRPSVGRTVDQTTR